MCMPILLWYVFEVDVLENASGVSVLPPSGLTMRLFEPTTAAVYVYLLCTLWKCRTGEVPNVKRL